MIIFSSSNESFVLAILFVIFILPLIIFLIVLAKRRKRPEAKGKRGEENVNSKISKIVPDYDKVVKNILIPKSNGEYTEIDTVLISSKGIFCIEIKNYSGFLYGDSYSKYWTQVLAYGNVKNQIYNPVLQNNGHINALNKILYNRFKIFNVVILNKQEGGTITSDNVYTSKSFKKYYNSLDDGVLLPREVNSIYNTLIKYIPTPEQKAAHIKRVREKYKK